MAGNMQRCVGQSAAQGGGQGGAHCSAMVVLGCRRRRVAIRCSDAGQGAGRCSVAVADEALVLARRSSRAGAGESLVRNVYMFGCIFYSPRPWRWGRWMSGRGAESAGTQLELRPGAGGAQAT